ncbi:MAG TPA: response regulator transcription factor [Stellaceae bacterium]|nr:response regulator transcription factor [Stellaceae bacterium]
MTDKAVRVLIVDDEPPIRRFLRTALGHEGYEILEASDAKGALEGVAREAPHLVILDLGLPDLDGIEVIRRIRHESKVPILVLSSRGEERAKVEALELGADDYLTKPFGIEELLARLRTALRHSFHEQGQEPVFTSGELTVDLVRRRVSLGAREVKLSPIEYDLLRLLVLHAGKVLTHQQILREVWGASGELQYLRVYVRQLRKKLEPAPERPRYILTEAGVGYRLRVEE